MRRSPLMLVLCALGGALLGLFMSSFPAPSDVATFWVGNFSSPWAALAFLAGWTQRSKAWAAIGGFAAEVACVAGFYAQFLSLDPDRLGLPRSTPLLTLIATDLSHWLWFISPWVIVAIGAGVIYGLFGRWWQQSRSLIAGAALALPFIVEPAAWRVYLGFGQGPLVLWAVEVAVGVAILGWVAAATEPPVGRRLLSLRRRSRI
jgi:hypothetical protein